MLQYLPGRTVEEKQGQFFVLFPGMAGVLSVARAVVDRHRQEQILEAAKSFYLRAFAGV